MRKFHQTRKRIRAARRKKGMSQAELADKVGISVPYVSDVENGKKTIGVDIFLRIAEALQVSTDWLLRADIPQNRYVNHSDAAELLEDCTSEDALVNCFFSIPYLDFLLLS